MSSSLNSQSDNRSAIPMQTSASPVQFIDIFPTRIWQVRLTELSSQVPGWVAAAQSLRARSPVPPKRSIREGWTSEDLTESQQAIFGDLHPAIAIYCRIALIDTGLPDPKVRIQSWINIQDRGSFNFLHMHVGALLTGCFYIQVPEGAGNLVLRDPRPGVLNTFVAGSRPNALADVSLGPEAGLLRLFPPWLEHHVEPNQSDLPRIALGFNAVRC